jgi:SNF2 family DNA or RNA helicase
MNGMSETLTLSNDHLVLDFPYDADRVAEIKRITGAKWDRVSRVWRVPIHSLDEARQFAAKHDFHIDPDVLTFSTPRRAFSPKGVYRKDDWVYLSFAYEPVLVKAVKGVPGITWDGEAKAWRAPLTAIRHALLWAERFNQPVDQELVEMADEVERQRTETLAAAKAVTAELDIPTLQGSLLPYQKAGILYAVNAKRSFIADDMGLGKTIQAIGALEHAGAYPALVVCPPGLVLNWKKEFAKWLPNRRVEVVANRSELPDRKQLDVLVVGYSNIDHWCKSLLGFKSYVFDESHYAKTPTAKRTKSAIKMARSADDDGLVLCLTGTPITNRPAEFGPQLDILGQLNKFGGLWGFYRRYCGAFRDRFGQWHIDGATNLEELNDTLRATCYIRRTKDQVLSDLPAVRHSRVVVTGTTAAMKEYNEAREDIIQYITKRAREIALELGKPIWSAAVQAKIKAESNEHLVRISVLRRLAAKAKMDSVYEWIDSKIATGDKVVVAAHHRDIVDAIAEHYCGLKIQGGMTVEDVEEAKAKFQAGDIDEAPVIVLSIQAAKTGHTLTAAQDVLFVELPWTPADVDQTYSRCHRIGQKGSVMSTYMLAAGTIDEEIFELIATKRSIVEAATEGVEGEMTMGTEQIVMNFLAEGLAGQDA